MSSSKEYLDFIIDQLSGLDDITYRMMMGEYMLYYKGRIFPYICDDRLLIKPVQAAIDMMSSPRYELPYNGAKPMLAVDNVDDREFLTEMVQKMYEQLPVPKQKKKA